MERLVRTLGVHELDPVADRHRQPVDLEAGHVHDVTRAFVVVGKAVRGAAHFERAGVHGDHVPGASPGDGALSCTGRAAGEAERLQHRLVVLLLVAQHELDQRPVAVEAVEDRARALAHRRHVLAHLRRAQVLERATIGARRLVGVVDTREVRPQQLEAACGAAEPQILECRDVAEIPRERAHQPAVDAVQVVVAHVLYERESPSPALLECREQPSDPSAGRCFGGGVHL